MSVLKNARWMSWVAVLACGIHGSRAWALEHPPLDSPQSIAVHLSLLVTWQEQDGEWPYEGVYRVGGKIPIGYRVGGTGICARALIEAPDFLEDAPRREAVERGFAFIKEHLGDPSMDPAKARGYDVRGWGWIYALHFFLRYKELAYAPKADREALEEGVQKCVKGLASMELKSGGWSYSNAGGGPAISFMTGPGLQALFLAKKMGYEVNEALLLRGLKALERGRAPNGAFQYVLGGRARNSSSGQDSPPGALARSPVAEATLMLAGRSSPARLSAAVNMFLEHWKWLKPRYQGQGTHVPPHGIAPYYVMFARNYSGLPCQ